MGRLTDMKHHVNSNTYLATISRHHWSRQITMTVDKMW